MNGRDVPCVHGCVLDHGHDGDHGAPAYPSTRNRSSGFAGPTMGLGLEAVEPSPPGRATPARPAQLPPDPHRRRRPARTHSTPPTSDHRRPADSQIAALWAIAAAIKRLADAVAAAYS